MANPKPGDDVRMKTFRLDQAKIDRARKALGTSTDTETVERALDLVDLRHRALGALDALEYDPDFSTPYDPEA